MYNLVVLRQKFYMVSKTNPLTTRARGLNDATQKSILTYHKDT